MRQEFEQRVEIHTLERYQTRGFRSSDSLGTRPSRDRERENMASGASGASPLEDITVLI